jgi:D-alanyl-D-alanine carboxypeptidase/D-alanyl-D-alanine-endopeptidase (penicillin-binding protein 4)
MGRSFSRLPLSGGSLTRISFFPGAGRTARIVALGLLLAAGAFLPVRAGVLPESVVKILNAAGVPEDSLSVYIRDVTQVQPLVSLNADVPRNPASVMKLVTTAAALHLLGPGFTWETHAYADGKLVGDRLDGDLVLKGYGDPYLVTESFWTFLRRLRVKGLRQITGDLVIDNSYFSIVPRDRGAFDGRPYHAYNVLPSALLVNFQTYEFQMLPDRGSRRIQVTTNPPSATLAIHNRLKYSNGHCRGQKFRIQMHVLEGLPDDTVRFSGSYPFSCGAHALLRTVSSHESFVHGVFTALWRELGGEFEGGVRSGTASGGARRLFVHRSYPLSDVIRPMNKFSNNVMTRNLFLTLGAERHGAPGTVSKGRVAVREWLQSIGVDPGGLVIENGSGLSRTSKASARLIGEMLLEVYRSPYMPEFISSLPLAAIDGTMRKRFRNGPMQGRMHVKTGLIDHVRSMGGYMLNSNGRTFVVVVLQNDRNIHHQTGTRIQDALIEWLFDR